MRWRRRPSSTQLESWLASGEPAWVEAWMDDPEVTVRLERLTALTATSRSTLHAVMAPTDGFEERTIVGVRARVNDLERVGVLFGLLGLAPRIASTLIDPDPD